MAALRMKCLCSDFPGSAVCPLMHSCAWMCTIIQPFCTPTIPAPLPPSIHSTPASQAASLRRLCLNKHITKLKYLQVSLIFIQPLFQSVSQWDLVSWLSGGRTCIDAHLNKAGGEGFVYVCFIPFICMPFFPVRLCNSHARASSLI